MTNKTNQRLKSVGDISISFDNLSQVRQKQNETVIENQQKIVQNDKFKVGVKKQLNSYSLNDTNETQDTSISKFQSLKQHNQAPQKQQNSQKNEKINISVQTKSVTEKPKLSKEKPLTAQEKLQLERRDEQNKYLKQLQLLTSDNCPKKHPFDLGYLELNDIKSQFPEFQKNQVQKGLEIKKLREILKKYLNLWKQSDNDLLDQLIDKLDRKNSNKITWDEFLRYLDQEGLRRDMVNQALLYGMGAKRLKEVNRINLKEAKEKDTYINTCLYMNFGPSFSFILTLDEKNKAKIYDSKQFILIQELLYPSNYKEPKGVSKFRTSNHNTLENQLAQNFANIEQDRGLMNAYNSNSVSIYSGKNSRVDLKMDNKKSKDQINFNKTRGSTFSAKVSESTEELVSNAGTQSQFQNQFNIKIAKSQSKDQKEVSPQKKVEKAYENQSPQKKVEKVYNNQSPNKQAEKKNNRLISANSQNKFNNRIMKNLETIVEEKLNSKVIRPRSRDQILSSIDTNGPYLQQNPYNLDLAPIQNDNQHQKKTRQYLFQTYGKRKLSSNKSKFEVLGIASLEEKEGSRANLMTKDQETDIAGYNIRFLMPNLRVQHKETKEKFDQKVQEVESQIFKSRQKLIQLENAASVRQKNPRRMITGAMSNNSAFDTSSFDSRTQPEQIFQKISHKNKNKSQHETLTKEEQNQIQQAQKIEKILTKKNIVAYKMNQLATKMEKQEEKLQNLSETNKYFYRQTSSTPFQIAQAQYMKQQMEKKGIDTMNSILVAQELTKMGLRADQKTIRDITGQMPDSVEESKNFCNSDMIMKYVETIQEKKNNQGESDEKLEHDSAVAKRKQVKHFKSVFALCATYNQDLSILAIALIDREVKIYKIKQNGALCQFVDYLSFYSKYYITCMFIERSVQNSKPILVMGSKSGEIEIYYLEDSKTKEQPKTKQHECSPFNFFFPKAAIQQRSQIFKNKQETKLFQDKIVDESTLNESSFDNQFQNINKIPEKVNNSQIFDRIILEETIQDAESSLNQDILERDKNQHLDQSIQIQKFDDVSQLEENPYSAEQPYQFSIHNGAMITASRPLIQKNSKGIQSQSQVLQALKFDPFDFSQPEIFNNSKKTKNENRFKKNKDDTGLNEAQKEKGMDEITQIRYIRDIGLIASSFNGTLKFFDAFNFKEYWSTNNQTRQKDENSDGEDFTMHDHFTTFDINTKLGLLVTGGVEGRMVLIDPYALGIVKNKRCHQSEILQLYIYAEQQQIISVAQDRSIGLWDSQLKKLEIIKDVSFGQIQASKFTSSTFDHQSGTLYVCCHQINVWQAQVDSKIEINAIQVQTLSKNILEERKFLEWQDPSWKWQQQELKDKGIVIKKKDADTKTGKVLVTNASQLVDILAYQANKNQDGDLFNIITVDSENLLRMWELSTSTTTQSYRCPVFGRVTAVAIDKTNQYLAVGSSLGEAVIINMKSGGVIYKLESCKNEITFLRFNELENEFWLFGGCWGGTFQFWSKPREDNKFTVSLRLKLEHKSDLLSIDTSNSLIATGDDKGIVGIWNIFSGQIKFLIEMPYDIEIKNQRRLAISRKRGSKEHDQNYENDKTERSQNQSFSASKIDDDDVQRNQTLRDFNNISREDFIRGEALRDFKKAIVQLEFHPFYQNYIQVMQESGHVHLIEAMNGSVYLKDIAIVQTNSSWACDIENYEVFIIGENGKAALFDNSLGCKNIWSLDIFFQKQSSDITNPGSFKPGAQVPGKSVRIAGKNGSKKREVRNEWINLNIQNQPYFQAYDPKNMSNNFVVSVKFVKQMKVFISGTSCGQVKIWTNRTCQQLAILNSPDWDPKRLISYINQELDDDDNY